MSTKRWKFSGKRSPLAAVAKVSGFGIGRTLRAKIGETSPPVLITEQGENGSQLEFPYL
jgi:hypothetical protein